MVTSPGGTTIAAIRHLEEAGVRAAFLNAIDAARHRGELAQGGEDDEDRRRPMGRGDRAKVRWAHDRARKKQAERRKAAARAAGRKAAKK